jgi:hypothetical protein
MSQSGKRIVCRRCDESFATESGSCPHCGAEVRSDRGPTIVIAIGVVLGVTSLLSIGELWFFGAVGVVMSVAGAYVLREKRQRMREASERAASDSAEDGVEGPEIDLG